MRATNERDARSALGVMLFPVNARIVAQDTVSLRDLPRIRSVRVSDVETRSIVGHDMAAPRGMLSKARTGTPSRKAAKIALRRSSASLAQAAAGIGLPVTAAAIIFSTVVLPPPRFPAVTKNTGRSAKSSRSITDKAMAIRTHFPS